MKLERTAVLWQEGKWFVAECVELEVASQGRSEGEALRNLEEAVLLYLQDDETGEVRVPAGLGNPA
ncbi:MAG TPA: type II toxin-antitoxin system HicB family antitoxin [Dehalococcoidia bacterium]|nr:type II toxin-antitoxin system HicB family antitoxin [Dehalococcoidia bacterium]HLB29724.1 type II toxin-antitoxin system HicB family antitoxin [Dehalococcoidia bacterium]